MFTLEKKNDARTTINLQRKNAVKNITKCFDVIFLLPFNY